MTATRDDLVKLGLLVGIEHWHVDDWKEELPVTRAVYWRDHIAPLHVAQFILLAKLEDRLFWQDDEEGSIYKKVVADYLRVKQRLMSSLDKAIREGCPVKWAPRPSPETGDNDASPDTGT